MNLVYNLRKKQYLRLLMCRTRHNGESTVLLFIIMVPIASIERERRGYSTNSRILDMSKKTKRKEENNI